MGYVWFLKKLKRCCVWFGSYKKRFVIHDPESLNSIPGNCCVRAVTLKKCEEGILKNNSCEKVTVLKKEKKAAVMKK